MFDFNVNLFDVPIYINNLLLDKHNHILEQLFYYDSCICSKQNK